MVLIKESALLNQNPSTRKERRALVVPEFEKTRSLQPFMRDYLDELLYVGEFDLAHDTMEYYFRSHEGTISDQLFSVAMQSIALPCHRWMHDEHDAPTGEQRIKAYETSVNLAALASQYHESSSTPAQKSGSRGIASETLFYAAATRLMATSEHMPLVVTPAPHFMDASSGKHGTEREGVDFLAYYNDLTIPIQVKTSSRQKQGYRPEILVVSLDQISSPEDHDHTQLLAAYQQELKDREPQQLAINSQDRFYSKLVQHAMTRAHALTHNNIAHQ